MPLSGFGLTLPNLLFLWARFRMLIARPWRVYFLGAAFVHRLLPGASRNLGFQKYL
jgi:hypothetical protein